MGQRDLMRLLVTGAMAVVQHASRSGRTSDPWLAGMLARKPKMLVAMALANRTARIVWAVTTKKENFRVRAAAGPGGERGEAKAENLSGDVGRTQETGKGKRSTRRGRKNQDEPEGHRVRDSDSDPISRTPYGPAANEGCIKRPEYDST